MKFNKLMVFTILCSVLLLSACGKDESVKANGESNDKEVEKIDDSDSTSKVEEIIDPNPKNDLSAEVDIAMEQFSIALVDFQVNINEYFYGYKKSNIEDYQKKALIETGELVNKEMNSIKLNAITEGDKEIEYLYEELKKYQDIRFQALKRYLDKPNDHDFEIINKNTGFVTDIAIKMIDIRAKDI
ncbi:hypothetical protein ACIQZG_21195 [Lysinibacillus sp. NPDC096418]|uniref:hypothetical protein n=1 Tax=Lysinibacillus sp. NPDC096418 TaxID=3364138 RepID=UPI00380DDC25